MSVITREESSGLYVTIQKDIHSRESELKD